MLLLWKCRSFSNITRWSSSKRPRRHVSS